jgi:hypothetical protein
MEAEGIVSKLKSRLCKRKRSRSWNQSTEKESKWEKNRGSYARFTDNSLGQMGKVPTSAREMLKNIANIEEVDSLNKAVFRLNELKAKGDLFFRGVREGRYKIVKEDGRKLVKESKFQLFLMKNNVEGIKKEEITRICQEIKRNADHAKFSQIGQIQVSNKDAKDLITQQGLGEHILNAYLQLVNINQDFHLFSSSFYNELSEIETAGCDYASFAISLKQSGLESLASKPYLLFPVCCSPAHWCVVLLNNPLKTIEFYDSAGVSNMRKICCSFERLTENLLAEVYDWEAMAAPAPENPADSGLVAIKMIQALARNVPFAFSVQDLKHYRKLMLAEIQHGRLFIDY